MKGSSNDGRALNHFNSYTPAYESKPLKDYHLQFVVAANEEYYDEGIDTFLKRVFTGQSPLEYDCHQNVARDGKSFALVSRE
jgi:hypothetical protein